MGVDNLSLLIKLYLPPSREPEPFDALIVDCQNYLYKAIDLCIVTEEAAFFNDICETTWLYIRDLIDTFIRFPCAPERLNVVLSFDGDGPPMKHPTQRYRRSRPTVGDKTFFRYVLFGNNTLTNSVVFYISERIRQVQIPLTAVVSGCNVPGEGEHKIFHIAEKMGYRKPVVASIDQDVFVLALLRLDRYDSLQVYRYESFYAMKALPPRVLDVSFLFGNDFIKTLVGITPTNVADIHQVLEGMNDEDAPAHLCGFLQKIQHRLRFERVPCHNRPLMIAFWMTYLWMLDYYTQRCFPQLFMENNVYDAFNRHQLLSGLLEVEYSRAAFHEAKERYGKVKSDPVKNAADRVYQDPKLLERLRAYWREPSNGICNVIRVTLHPTPAE